MVIFVLSFQVNNQKKKKFSLAVPDLVCICMHAQSKLMLALFWRASGQKKEGWGSSDTPSILLVGVVVCGPV